MLIETRIIRNQIQLKIFINTPLIKIKMLTIVLVKKITPVMRPFKITIILHKLWAYISTLKSK